MSTRDGFESIHKVWLGVIRCFVLVTFPVDYEGCDRREAGGMTGCSQNVKRDLSCGVSVFEIEQQAWEWHRQEDDSEIGRFGWCFTTVGHVRRENNFGACRYPSQYTSLVSGNSQHSMRHTVRSIVEHTWGDLPFFVPCCWSTFGSIKRGETGLHIRNIQAKESQGFVSPLIHLGRHHRQIRGQHYCAETPDPRPVSCSSLPYEG